jgi:hypothetical protein
LAHDGERTLGIHEQLSSIALGDLCVRGVVFCDDEGERIDSLVVDPGLSAYDLDVLGASLAPAASVLLHRGGGQLLVARLSSALLLVSTVGTRCYVGALLERSSLEMRVRARLVAAAQSLEKEIG